MLLVRILPVGLGGVQSSLSADWIRSTTGMVANAACGQPDWKNEFSTTAVSFFVSEKLVSREGFGCALLSLGKRNKKLQLICREIMVLYCILHLMEKEWLAPKSSGYYRLGSTYWRSRSSYIKSFTKIKSKCKKQVKYLYGKAIYVIDCYSSKRRRSLQQRVSCYPCWES